ncbi:MAG: tetratricopeptide repeat protein [Dehalococcoidia bacterium]|jgi:tetratricopeptide (TPR) repeat protein
MKSVLSFSRILFIGTLVLVAIAVAGSCSRPRPQASENGTYASNVNSESVGTQFGPAQYQIGLAYLSQDNYQEALKAFTAAINNGYSTRDVHFGRAQAYAGLGLYSGTIGEASICLDMEPNDAAAYELRGTSYLDSGEYQKAKADFTLTLATDASSKEAYFSRGLAFKDMGEFDNAVTDFKRAVSLDPSYLSAVMWLGRTYYALTYYAPAIEQFSRAIDIDLVEAAVAYNDRAVCEGRNGDLDAALADLNVLVGLHPSFCMVFYNRGVVYGKMNKSDPSIVDLDTYLCLDATDKYGLSGLAADWLGTYTQDYIYTDEAKALEDQSQAICNNILAQSVVQKDLSYKIGALYFPKEIESAL